MKVSMSCTSDYDSKYDWDCNCQGGEDGLVIKRKGGAYNTAFFEAFQETQVVFFVVKVHQSKKQKKIVGKSIKQFVPVNMR